MIARLSKKLKRPVFLSLKGGVCLTLLLVLLIALPGCAPQLEVTLESPATGSSVSSLTPILAWTCTDTSASYRVQTATDSNFQQLVIDASNLASPSYSVPSGKLSNGKTYYWRVSASKGEHTSDWTSGWSFSTPTATGTVIVEATLDGSAWSGQVSYTIHGPKEDSSYSSVSQSFSNLPAGTYTLTYNSGGPSGATLASTTPSPTQTLSSGGTITFTLNFHTQTAGSIYVRATLDGSPWSGQMGYSIQGPRTDSSYSVPDSFSNLPAGSYTISYTSGGPSGATLGSIYPSTTQTLSSDGSITFTLKFYTTSAGNILVQATLDGQSWSGRVSYTIDGPRSDSGRFVSNRFSNLPAGTYTLYYTSGGPAGATLGSIYPSATQTLPSGGVITFILKFYTQSAGTIFVQSTLDGSPWSGRVSYTIRGPRTDSSYYVPDSFSNLPSGTYTLTYSSGGPTGATFVGVGPSARQYLSPGDTITFTLNFQSQATGTISVRATLDGSPWSVALGSGTISYTVSGPRTHSSNTVPDSFSNMPPGTYTLSYTSGGPIGATLVSITPSPRQNLPSGGSITFTMNFQTQAKGTVLVRATLDGEPWSGQVDYVLSGPYMDSGEYVPDSFTDCPSGSYALGYKSGGPHQSILLSITPPSQNLSPGGTITFILNFRFQGGIK